MKTRDFFFNIDKKNIAQYPPEKRGNSRLMVLHREGKRIVDTMFSELPELIKPGTVLVINDSRVRKARVFGISQDTGGKVEFLFLKQLSPVMWKVLPNKSRKQKPGKTYCFGNNITGTIVREEGACRVLCFQEPVDEDFFEKHGHMPLPPYIRRKDEQADEDRYQTVYSGETGSSAAPTAGLHFTPGILSRLKNNGIQIARVTLHVGIGTFIPIRTENIEDHVMHEEEYNIPEPAAELIGSALKEKRQVIAVGTTCVRTLESAYRDGNIIPGRNKTSLFIYPGYRFHMVSGLLTNFHTPGSSLLVLVSAFGGYNLIRQAYTGALQKGYRFFSYGDAMLIV
ncbi:MAG: tRNA preQ1(34) S-adenosylmethionine ribosyltransferase-isomerase QueA [Spirochaetales bacterium]|nr:tRNA preQ1(34) S-adenosylmethionine ribosyltransferase-isomerase QueA [Spirochaetales bacterium]